MDDKQNQPITNQSVAPSGQAPIAQPVSGGKKEALASAGQSREWVSASTPEIVLPKEVQEAGVEAQPSIPQIPDGARQQGVEMGHQNLPVQTVASESMGMTTPKSVLQQLKAAHKSVKDSLSWLVRLILKEQEKKENHTTSGYN